jgi:MFS transporter, NNP family, nitrate/nitrite transporter
MQMQRTPRKGAISTLIVSFLHFDLSFMLWVLLGSLGIFITKSLGLNPAQQGLMVAIPILSGSLLRIPVGLLSDRFGGKRVGVVLLLLLFLPLLLGWLLSVNLPALLGIGLLLGVGGASFSVSLPLASHWYPPSRQGLVMGIAAAGNSGTVIANLAAPPLANAFGWQNVLGLAMVPLALVLLAFLLLAKDSPNRPEGQPIGRYLVALRHGDIWWFCLLYSVTFGGFVGLSSFLPLFLRNQYALSPVPAGLLTALVAFMGSTFRPVGGYLADRFGGVRMLSLLLVGIGIVYAIASSLPSLGFMLVLLMMGMLCLGMGNGAVFQLVPQRFRAELGVATGVVGAFGGLGGFLLPTLLGSVKQLSGSFAPGLLLLATFALTALVVLRILAMLQEGWRLSWAIRVAKS